MLPDLCLKSGNMHMLPYCKYQRCTRMNIRRRITTDFRNRTFILHAYKQPPVVWYNVCCIWICRHQSIPTRTARNGFLRLHAVCSTTCALVFESAQWTACKVLEFSMWLILHDFTPSGMSQVQVYNYSSRFSTIRFHCKLQRWFFARSILISQSQEKQHQVDSRVCVCACLWEEESKYSEGT